MAVEKIKLNQSDYNTEGQKVEYDPIKAQMSGININNGVAKDTVSFGSEGEEKKSGLGNLVGLGVLVAGGILLYKKNKTVQEYAQKAWKSLKGLFNKGEQVAEDAAKVTKANPINQELLNYVAFPGSRAGKNDHYLAEIVKDAAKKKAEALPASAPKETATEIKKTLALPAPEPIKAKTPEITVKKNPVVSETPAAAPAPKTAATEVKKTLALPAPEVKKTVTPDAELSNRVKSLKSRVSNLAQRKTVLQNQLPEISTAITKNEYNMKETIAKIERLKQQLRGAGTIEELTTADKTFHELTARMKQLNKEKQTLLTKKAKIETAAQRIEGAIQGASKTTTETLAQERHHRIGQAIKTAERTQTKAARVENSAQAAAQKQQQRFEAKRDKLYGKITKSTAENDGILAKFLALFK